MWFRLYWQTYLPFFRRYFQARTAEHSLCLTWSRRTSQTSAAWRKLPISAHPLILGALERYGSWDCLLTPSNIMIIMPSCILPTTRNVFWCQSSNFKKICMALLQVMNTISPYISLCFDRLSVVSLFQKCLQLLNTKKIFFGDISVGGLW